MKRCQWTGADHIMQEYHDKEWGVPLHEDTKLFEFLILEGMQAGLSWSTVLKKRENFRNAFKQFDPKKVAKMTEKELQKLLQDPGIIRNKLKITSAVRNAKVFLKIQEEFGTFNTYIWGFVNNKPVQNEFIALTDIPSKTEISERISKDLKKRGMNFVGSTIIYAFMQATGMVNDHTKECFRYKQLKKNQ